MVVDITMERIILAYASQTGQSKAIAEDMYELVKCRGINIETRCLSSFGKEFSLVNEKYMLFVVSTTGDGDPPDVATKFWRSLKKSKENLENMSYALLGLGDTNYTNFCNFGKMLDKRLREMNAKPLYPSMWADDAVGLENVTNVWMEETAEKLSEIFGTDEITSLVIQPDETVMNITYNISSLNINNALVKDVKLNVLTTNDNEKNKDLSTQIQDINSPLNSSDEPVATNQVDKTSIKSYKENMFLDHFEIDMDAFDTLKLPSCPARILEIIPDGVQIDLKQTTFPSYFNEPNHFSLPMAQTPLGLATLKSARNFTEGKEGVKTIVNLEFDVSECSWDAYILPGDSVSIICPNNDGEVEELLSCIGVEDSQRFQRAKFEVVDATAAAKKKISLPEKCRIVDLVAWHMDIRGVPKKAFLRSLAGVTGNEEERKCLEILSSTQGSDAYSKIFVERRLTIVDLLKLLPTCHPSLGLLYEHLPKLLPRPYSVCNSQMASKDTVSIVFSLLEYETSRIPPGQRFDAQHFEENVVKTGLCTGWLYKQYQSLTSLVSPIKVAMFLRKPTLFRLPDLSTPLIMIGAGTGVSPFIGFLQQRSVDMKKGFDIQVGETWLFLGCRGQGDFIFRENLEEFKSLGVLNHLQVCFSRESDPKHPRYVQDGVISCGAELVSLIMKTDAKIYICGDAKKMTTAVKSALLIILKSHSDLPEEDVNGFCEQLKTNKRIIEDVWT